MNVEQMKNARFRLHNIISIYLIFGGFLTSNVSYKKIHFFVCFLVILQWVVFDNRCFLSEYDHDSDTGYSKEVFCSIGVDLDPTQLNIISYMLILIPMAHSFSFFYKTII
jgi:hypothetical protein